MSSQQQRSRHRALGGQGIPQQGESDVGAFGGPYTTYDDDEGRSRSPTHPLRLPAQFPPWQAVVEQPRDINTHGRRPAPPVPSSLVGGYRTTPSRPRKDETSTQPSATYQSGELESPRYHWAEQEDTKSLGPASMHSDRSIYIGFDPSEEPRDSLNSSLGIIPHFPAVVSAQQQRRPPPAGNNQPPPSRRVTPAYFSQTPSMQVTPIPEESTSPRRASYASSTAIPTAWDPNHFESSSDDQQSRKTQLQQRIDEYVEPGLVRQASFGRKTKPTLTTINRSKSNNSLSNAGPSTTPGLPPAAMSPGASGSLPRIITGAGQSPLLASKPAVSSPISQPAMAAVSSKSHERDGLDNEVRGSRSLFYKDTGGFRSPSNRESGSRRAFDKETSTPFDVTTPRKGAGRTRLKPPRLNLDSVRDAEARGSLTSLPDLIRRATKLAAVLERGRPSSQAWGARGSMFDRSKPPTSLSNDRETDSISDILAAFPSPALGRNTPIPLRMSQWPPADDYNGDGDGSIHQVKDGRRLCGLPVWIFIVLVLLAMVVITAAVVVPIQLNMKSSIAELSALGQCRVNNPCQNGGENVANDNFCGCICTGGYTGTSCTEKEIPDLACTNYDFNDRNTTSGVIRGVKNVTIGSAIPRLFDKASSYNIDLDPTMLLGVFTTARLSCTLQNALVNFNGKTSPDDTELRRRSGGLITDLRLRRRREKRQIGTETSTRSTATSTSTFASATASASSILTNALNADTVDFGRVAVLYIAQQSNVEEAAAAQQALNDTFKAGIDYGKLQTGDATVLLDERSIILSDGNVVGGGGGVVVSTVTRTLTPAMATATRV